MTVPGFKRLGYLLMVAMLPLIVWTSYNLGYRYLLSAEITDIQGQLDLFTVELEAEIEKFFFLPRVLSRNEKLKNLLSVNRANNPGIHINERRSMCGKSHTFPS